jgi:hypothetical protein
VGHPPLEKALLGKALVLLLYLLVSGCEDAKFCILTASDAGEDYAILPFPSTSGPCSWVLTREESFMQSRHYWSDGSKPVSGLVFDAAGNIHGTTRAGSASGVGAVFELRP